MKILLIVILLSGCGMLDTYKRELRVSETEAVRSIVDSSIFLLCASPVPMIKEQLTELELVAAWDIMCGHKLMGYTLVKSQ